MKFSRPAFSLLSLIFFSFTPVFAQEAGHVPLPDEMNILDGRYFQSNRAFAKTQAAWRNFLAGHSAWETIWNRSGNTPHRAWGDGIRIAPSGLATADDAAAAARTFAESHASLLAFDGANARLTQAENVLGKWYVKFRQQYRGLDVLNAYLDLRVSADGRVFLFGSDFVPSITVDPVPSIARAAAMEFAKAGLAYTPGTDNIEGGELFILPLRLAASVDARLVYHFRLRTSPSEAWETYVDAHSGDVLWRYNSILSAAGDPPKSANAVHGRVTASISPRSYIFGAEDRPVAFEQVIVNGDTAFTDANGEFTIDVGGATSATCATKFYGKYFWVRRGDLGQGGSAASFSQTVTPGTQVDIHWDDANSTASERNMFYHANYARSFIRAIDPSADLSDLDRRMIAMVRITTDSCNAYYDPSAQNINFFKETISCADPASIPDVLYHEYGHAINDFYYIKRRGAGMISGALNEGTADINAILMTDNPGLGIGFFRTPDPLRMLDNTRSYPDLANESHADGEIVAGAVWDMRKAIGLDAARRLAHFCKKGTPDGSNTGQAFVDYFLEMLTADDDDGNLSNGTPHSAEITAAFLKHGIPAYMTLSHTPIKDQDGLSSDGYPLKGNVSITPIIATSVTLAAAKTSVVWSTDNWKSSSETPVNQAGGVIDDRFPNMKPGSIVRYYLSVTDNFGMRHNDPPNAPARNYLFLVGYQTKLFQPMEADTGWVVDPLGTDDAETGKWVDAKPVGTIAQPDTDHTPGPANIKCWVTGNAAASAGAGTNDVDDGTTTLQSPRYDLSGYRNPVLRYWRWYSNDRGATPGTDTWVAQISSDDGATWSDMERTMASSDDWIPIVLPVRDVIAPTDKVRLRFLASDLGAGSLVEAAIDDVEFLDINPLINGAEEAAAPQGLRLGQNYPNPVGARAGAVTDISYTLPARMPVTLSLYDPLGRLIRTLVSAEEEPGAHTIRLDASTLVSGVYMYELHAGTSRLVRRMSVIR